MYVISVAFLIYGNLIGALSFLVSTCFSICSLLAFLSERCYNLCVKL